MQDRQVLSSEKQPIESPKFPFEQLLIVDKSRKEIKRDGKTFWNVRGKGFSHQARRKISVRRRTIFGGLSNLLETVS